MEFNYPKWIGARVSKVVIGLFIFLLLLNFVNSAEAGTQMQSLGSSTTGGQAYIGTASVGNISAFNFTASSSYALKTIEVYISSYNDKNFTTWVALYSDNSGAIGNKLSSYSENVTNYFTTKYNNYTLYESYNLVSGTAYWLVFFTNESTDGTNNGRYYRIGETTGTGGGLWARGDGAGVPIAYNSNGGSNVVKTANIRLYNGTSPSDFITQLAYTTPVISGEAQTIYFNVTNKSTSGTLSQINATLWYNNTAYNMTQVFKNDSSAGFYYTFNTPSFTSNQIVNGNVTYYANTYHNYENINQVVYTIPSLNITSLECTPKLMQFNFYDEENFTSLNATISYNFKFGLTNNTQVTTSGSTTATTLFICGNSSVSSYYNIGYSEIDYDLNGWVARRWYGFSNQSVNFTSLYNNSLYTLNDALATAFQLIVQTSGGTYYTDKIVALVRYYNGLNAYKIVDVGITDETGSSVIYVRVQDVDYRIAVYDLDGTLIKLANPIRMVCLATPCSYTLKISPGDVDYTEVINIQKDFTFNSSTNIWRFTYTDNTLATTSVNLSVYQATSTGDTLICSSVVSGSTGAVTCNTSGYVGRLTGEVYRIPGNIPIAQRIEDIITSPFTSEFGLWLTLVIAIPIILVMTIISPSATLVGSVLAFIPALYLGSVNWAIVAGIALLAFIVSHFIKRVS